MTKDTAHQLFISQSTRDALVHPGRELEFVDEMEVRGRQTRIRIWTLANLPQARDGDGGAEKVGSPPPGGPATPDEAGDDRSTEGRS
jgi:hypothetical protein